MAVAMAVGREGSKMSSRRLVMAVQRKRWIKTGATWKYSKRSVVAVAGVMVVQRRRWIGMEPMMGAEGPVGRR